MRYLKALLTFFALVVFVYTNAQVDTITFSKPQKLGDPVNSAAEESIPIISPDGKALYFARTFHKQNIGGMYSGQDIWKSLKTDDKFEAAANVAKLNNKGSNVVVGVSHNGNRLYLLNQFSEKGNPTAGVSVSDYNQTLNAWSDPRVVVVPDLNIKGDFYSALVSPEEDYILWSIPIPDDTLGNDLYVSLSSDKGTSWSAPMALGNTINGMNDEISPFYDTKNGLLFFAKNRTGDTDDYDIYYAKRLDNSWTNWSEPVKAGDGINSAKFDAYYYSDKDGTAYFSSNRNDSLSNIYLSELLIAHTKMDSIERIDSTAVVEVAHKDGPMPDPVLIIETKNGGESRERLLSSLTKEELLDKDTRIRFVYFDYDKYNITAKYIEVLDDAARILDDYPNMGLLIEGHTDAIGSQAYNQVLSDNRAAAAKEFLVINGVVPDRIITKGMGKKEPYATNLTEEGRALNRRVEMYFTEKK